MSRPCQVEHAYDPGRPWAPGNCRLCYLYHHDPRYRRLWTKPKQRPRRTSFAAARCAWIGEDTGERLPCPRTGQRTVELYRCYHPRHPLCTLLKPVAGCACCAACWDRPPKRTRLPVDGFNGSLIRYHGRLLIAWRREMAGSEIHLAEVSEDLQAVREIHRLDLRHPLSSSSREDPRLFLAEDRLWLAYTGVTERRGDWGNWVTQVLYCRLGSDLQPEQVWCPQIDQRQWPKEKNHSYFGADGRIYCVYQSEPTHRVLEVERDQVVAVYETPNPLPWSGGHLRGGASPVRVGDLWYHWIHGGSDSPRRYNVGLVVFEARPPFRVVRQTPEPLEWDDPATKPKPQYCPVIFPAGAILENGLWRVSCGIHDHWIAVHDWPEDAVERAIHG